MLLFEKYFDFFWSIIWNIASKTKYESNEKNKNASQIVSFYFFKPWLFKFFLVYTFDLLLGRRETITLYSPDTYLRFLELVSFWNEIFSVIPFAPCIHTKRTKTNQLIQFVPMLFVPINKQLWPVKNWSH